MSGGAPLLEVRDVALRFGGIVALDGVSFDLDEGQILGLIGPNGAGKTTLFNCVSRLYTPNRGDILFEGRSMLGRPPHRIAEIGIGRTFQNLALFARNRCSTMCGSAATPQSRSDFVSDTLHLPWVRRAGAGARRRPPGGCSSCSSSVPWRMQLPAGLPLGTRKRVELARALAARPKLLLLDEPAGGLSHERSRRARRADPPHARRARRSRCCSSSTT